MTFGEKLQELRKKAGLSQDALAEKLEVSRQAVSKWERDETMPETEKAIRIAQLFHVSLDSLLMDKEDAEAEPTYRKEGYQQHQYSPETRNFGVQGQLERFVRQHGYKAGYIMMSIGAIICSFSLIMYFVWPAIGNSFFDGATGSFGSFGQPQIYVQGDLTPAMEDMIINELIGSIDMDGMWGNSMNGVMNSALKTQAGLFLIGMFPGILLLVAGAFVVVKGKKYAAQRNA